jgi:hypothetical protein
MSATFLAIALFANALVSTACADGMPTGVTDIENFSSEAECTLVGLDTTSFELPTPSLGLDDSSQVSQFDIQAAPEPSAAALGCLALGLFAIVRLQRPASALR